MKLNQLRQLIKEELKEIQQEGYTPIDEIGKFFVVKKPKGKMFKELMEMDNSRLTFDIQKLVNDEIIFITLPGDGKGGIAKKQNWSGDCSVLTLLNITDEELKLNPWREEAMKRQLPKCIPYVQNSQNKWSKEKYLQVIDSIIEKKKEMCNWSEEKYLQVIDSIEMKKKEINDYVIKK
jgi:hypothetical protein